MNTHVDTVNIEVLPDVWDDIFFDGPTPNTTEKFDSDTENADASNIRNNDPIISEICTVELSDREEFNNDPNYKRNARNSITIDLQPKEPISTEVCNEDITEIPLFKSELNDKIEHTVINSRKTQIKKSLSYEKRRRGRTRKFPDSNRENGNAFNLQNNEPVVSEVCTIELSDSEEFDTDPSHNHNVTNDIAEPISTETSCYQDITKTALFKSEMNDKTEHTAINSTNTQIKKSLSHEKRRRGRPRKFVLRSDSNTENGDTFNLQNNEPVVSEVCTIELSDSEEFDTDPSHNHNVTNDIAEPISTETSCYQDITETALFKSEMNDKTEHTAINSTNTQIKKSLSHEKRRRGRPRKFVLRSDSNTENGDTFNLQNNDPIVSEAICTEVALFKSKLSDKIEHAAMNATDTQNKKSFSRQKRRSGRPRKFPLRYDSHIKNGSFDLQYKKPVISEICIIELSDSEEFDSGPNNYDNVTNDFNDNVTNDIAIDLQLKESLSTEVSKKDITEIVVYKSELNDKVESRTVITTNKQIKKSLSYQKRRRGRPRKFDKEIRSHACNLCGKTFSYRSVLIAHIRSHTKEKPFSCGICNKCFTLKQNLMVHFRTHTNQKPLLCDICYKSFSDKNHLNSHMSTHVNEKSYKCRICNKVFSEQSDLYGHPCTHESSSVTSLKRRKMPVCDSCKTGFRDKKDFNTHFCNKSEETHFKCNYCSKMFSKKLNLKAHLRIHTNEQPFECSFCNKVFALKTYLNSHLRIHSNEKPYKCKICNKAFTQPSALLYHHRTHTKEKLFVCDLCGKAYSNRSTLNLHIRSHSDKACVCDACKMGFLKKNDFDTHLCNKTKEKNFICNTCGKTFSEIIYLIGHLRTHSDEKQFKCDKNEPHVFAQKPNLTHFRIHTTERNFICDICKKAFTQKIYLNSHLLSHSKEKRFVCEICNKRFKHKQSLNNHLRIHTGEKPFKCEFCDKRCVQKSNLMSHMRSHANKRTLF